MNNEYNKQESTSTATLEKIRPELNLEKWSVWQPAKSKNAPKARTFQREITLVDGSKAIAKVKIGFTDEGVLTTEDQKTYYALVKHWEERGRDGNNPTSFSLQQLAKYLGKKWGTDVIDSLTKSLRRLRATPFTWENSYFDNSTKQTIELLEIVNILSELKIITRKKDGAVNKELGYFRFNDFILKNLQTNHTKPVFFDVVVNFKSEIAQLLYTHLDLILCDKMTYERRTKELFDDLGITGKAYDQRSNRKQKLKPALAELSGIPLSRGGIIASAAIEETQDKNDYKIVIQKSKQPGTKRTKLPATADPVKNTDTLESRGVVTEEPATPIFTPSPVSIEQQHGEDFLRYFNTVFFNAETVSHSRAKHRDLAVSLVAQYGFDLCKHIVDFAHTEAQKTKFKIATFGGITQYIDRAVADYEHRRKQQEQEAAHAAEMLHQQQLETAYEAYRATELKRYVKANYTREQYEALVTATKQELRNTIPLVAKWSDDALNETAHAKVQRTISQQIPFLTFEEFCQRSESSSEPLTLNPEAKLPDPPPLPPHSILQPVLTATHPETDSTPPAIPIRES